MPIWAVEKQYYEMPELVGFQTMVILLDPKGMTFDAGGVFGLDFWLLLKSGSSYCALLVVMVTRIGGRRDGGTVWVPPIHILQKKYNLLNSKDCLQYLQNSDI